MQSVTLSNTAIEHFMTIAKNKVVTFGLQSGGCSGFEYAWNILDYNEVDDTYEMIDYDEFALAVDKMSIMYLIGCEIDYVSDITGNYIKVNNPLATAGCGCGASVTFGDY